MRKQNQTTQESSPKVPAYIVTFSDMVTLLLTFFVMLLSLASVQDPELFNMGRGSFIQSIKELGLGMLYGRKPRPDSGNAKIKYFISTPDKLLQVRTIDAKEEELRRIFTKISRSMTTIPSQIIAKNTALSVTNIRFSPGQITLNESAKKYLAEFCLGLQNSRRSIPKYFGTGSPLGIENREGLYVLGLANETSASSDEPQMTEKQQWLLSARRAQAVANFLQNTLQSRSTSGPPAWHIYWWGAGPGGDWVAKDSPISRHSQILIAVLRASD